MPQTGTEQQVVLILCGLVGAGKSTFAKALETHYPRFKRCNQDDLGDRRLVEDLARASLAAGLSVCIDRTNFDSQQRSHWVKIAREFPGVAVWVLSFNISYDICSQRLASRLDHPTIHGYEQGLSVLDRMAHNFRPAAFYEGFDRIYRIYETKPDYSRDEIAQLLNAISTSPPPPVFVQRRPPASTPRRAFTH
ncbi:P-loop containing nucleoside triphosphate hydrolase protein [Sistotremastrum niveocremeum HHB9708]|uniref:p-loop containing nucleoside triphosphate hydrolase protein n=1 Tax=Sistotremastrum niveocremeum HHB9708 TaxID=1314777 RepID=A0A164VRW0_9AGAM|nr:P-loop containing nucleoside triphosphate hydrolase protein [Sistotremastrum niveocremeum HHB9708]